MNLRDRLAATADRLFTSFASVVVAGTYTRKTAAAYDPATGIVTPSSKSLAVSVILDTWKQDQVDGDVIKAGDRIAKIRASELGAEPSTDDELQLPGQLWQVRNYSTDPGGIVFDIHIRAKQ